MTDDDIDEIAKSVGIKCEPRFGLTSTGNVQLRAFARAIIAASASAQPVAWREHVEQRLLTWRQRFVNKSGDQLALDDFMGQESIDDLIDFVCDEYADPPPQSTQHDCGEAGHAEGRCGNASCIAPPQSTADTVRVLGGMAPSFHTP